MYKIKLKPTYDHTIPAGSLNWKETIRDHVRVRYFNKEMIKWIFENINGLFIIDNGYIYFKNDEDALAFKLRWT